MGVIEPGSGAEVAQALKQAGAEERPLLVVGGRTHLDKGNPTAAEDELSTRKLGRVVAYEPAEMLVVAEAGVTFAELDGIVAEHGQEWPVDAPPEATVGGIIAAGVSSPRRLLVGGVRDTVLELQVVTGDGRELRAGARTVKNVAGFDLCRLLTGSLGTLGVITQAALKLRPRPRHRRTLTLAGGFDVAERLLASVPLPAAVLVTPRWVALRLEGWQVDVEAQAERAAAVAGPPLETEQDSPFPPAQPWRQHPVTVEAAVAPARLEALAAAAGGDWGALAGVGTLWAGLPSAGEPLAELRHAAAELGGIAPVVRGPGGLGPGLPAAVVQRRIKHAFDPAGILAPGRFWGGI